jgi:uncharacterized protein YegP (UPF0339 family)
MPDYYQDDAGEWRWRFVSPNGRIMADSSEGYASERNARRAYGRVVALIQGGGK